MSGKPKNVIVLDALIKKRRETAFRITEMERETETVRANLVHLDAVIRLFAPNVSPEQIPPQTRRPRQLAYFAHGEITRRALDMLRAGGTVKAVDIAKQAMTDKGFSFEGDRRTRIEFCRRITMQLTNMARKGTVEKIGVGRGSRWQLAGET